MLPKARLKTSHFLHLFIMKIENIERFHMLENKYNIIKKLCDFEISEMKVTYKDEQYSNLYLNYIPDEIIQVIQKSAHKIKLEIEKEIELL